MNILFLCYWGIDEGLTRATVLPHVRILAAMESVEKVIICTIERDRFDPFISENKITHVPLYSLRDKNMFWSKIKDFTDFPQQIEGLCRDERINYIFARSALAAGLCARVAKQLKIPYLVESFEPHAQYMNESGVWSKIDVRFWIEKYFEHKQIREAEFLLPVSYNYERVLKQKGVRKERLLVMPCCVDINHFSFSPEQRQRIRRALNIPQDSLVGIYAGKYGGIYYCEEAFDLYRKAFEFFGPSFCLIILSAQDHENIRSMLAKFSLPADRIRLLQVPHNLVPAHLSAADFAFTTYKPSDSKKFLSPIKIGEYWANGLPVLIERGIGDDADIIEREGGGVIMDMKNIREAFMALKSMMTIGRSELAKQVQEFAWRYRSLDLVRQVYAKILNR